MFYEPWFTRLPIQPVDTEFRKQNADEFMARGTCWQLRCGVQKSIYIRGSIFVRHSMDSGRRSSMGDFSFISRRFMGNSSDSNFSIGLNLRLRVHRFCSQFLQSIFSVFGHLANSLKVFYALRVLAWCFVTVGMWKNSIILGFLACKFLRSFFVSHRILDSIFVFYIFHYFNKYLVIFLYRRISVTFCLVIYYRSTYVILYDYAILYV